MRWSARTETPGEQKKSAADPWEDDDDEDESVFGSRGDDPSYTMTNSFFTENQDNDEGQRGESFLKNILPHEDQPETPSGFPSDDPFQKALEAVDKMEKSSTQGDLEEIDDFMLSVIRDVFAGRIRGYGEMVKLARERDREVSLLLDHSPPGLICPSVALCSFFFGAASGIGIGGVLGIRDFIMHATRRRAASLTDRRAFFGGTKRVAGTTALVLTVATTTQCVVAGIRKKRDPINPIIGGALAGGLWGLRARLPQKRVGVALGAGMGAICSALGPNIQALLTPAPENRWYPERLAEKLKSMKPRVESKKGRYSS